MDYLIKVEKPEYVSGFDLINNLEDQVMEFDKWQSSIATLADKGINDGLISELRDMGPRSLAQIRALKSYVQTRNWIVMLLYGVRKTMKLRLRLLMS